MTKREFTIKLNGNEYPVSAEGATIAVNGRPFTVEIADDGTVLVDGIAYSVVLEGETATMGEESFPFEVSGLAVTSAAPAPPPPAAFAASEAGTGAVLAIMPGKIIRVLVEPGQAVDEGEPVCVLEAMKMENELNARQSGTVKAVHVSPGDDVQKDQVLVEIE
jgi:glutaconyl-CoA decarboxylase